MKTFKGVASRVTKRVVTQARAGVDYENIKTVAEGRANGTLPASNGGLPWGAWATKGGKSLFPHVIKHTPKGQKRLKYYLRFTTLNGATAKVAYAIDGRDATSDEVRAITLASEWQDKDGEVFNVALDSMLDVH